MPVSKGTYQCLLCDDIFKADSSEFSKCKCGQTEIKPSLYSYSYKNDNKGKQLEYHSYYLENEFIKLSESEQAIYNEIKRIKKDNGYKYSLFEMTERGEHGENYLSDIELSYEAGNDKYTSERNEIKLSINLKKRSYFREENLEGRLQKFLDMMHLVEAGEFDVTDRSFLVKRAEEDDIDYSEEPTGDTNITFYY